MQSLKDYNYPILWHESCKLERKTKQHLIEYNEVAEHFVGHSIEDNYYNAFLRNIEKELTND